MSKGLFRKLKVAVRAEEAVSAVCVPRWWVEEGEREC